MIASKTAATVALLASIALVACRPHRVSSPAAGQPAASASLDRAIDQSVAAQNGHDPAAVARLYAADSEAFVAGHPNLAGPAAIQANATQTFGALPDFHFTLSDRRIDRSSSGDLALLRARYAASGTNPNSKATFQASGNYIAAYRRQPDGAWKIAWSMVAPVTAASPPGGGSERGARPAPIGRPSAMRHRALPRRALHRPYRWR